MAALSDTQGPIEDKKNPVQEAALYSDVLHKTNQEDIIYGHTDPSHILLWGSCSESFDQSLSHFLTSE